MASKIGSVESYAGIGILLVVIVIVLCIRRGVNKSNNSVLKGAMKISDTVIYIRFFIFIFIILAIILFFVFKKKS